MRAARENEIFRIFEPWRGRAARNVITARSAVGIWDARMSILLLDAALFDIVKFAAESHGKPKATTRRFRATAGRAEG